MTVDDEFMGLKRDSDFGETRLSLGIFEEMFWVGVESS